MPRGKRNTVRNIFARLVIDENGCATWPQAKRGPKGYGAVEFDGRMWFVHRLIYEHCVEPVPPGMQLDHLCRNPSCANFAHLEVVTQAENMRRGYSPSALNARKTHCPRGHEYSHVENGYRQCRICCNERKKNRWRRKNGWYERHNQSNSGQTLPGSDQMSP